MRALPLLLLTACPYVAPDNPAAEDPPNVITGTVTLGAREVTGPVVVLLTDAANPMPPSGTGRPTTFTTVAPGAFTDGTTGTRSAAFALTGVPDGDWVLTGLLDADRNFHPSVPTLSGATCGDVVGAHVVDLDDRALGVVTLGGGERVGDVPVVLAVTVPTSRPTFTVADGADTVSPTTPLSAIRLESVPIEAAYGPLALTVTGPFDPAAPDPCAAAFWVHLVDDDADGQIDPHPDYPPELGVPDVWPRVYLEWLGTPVDTDDDGETNAFDKGALSGTRFLTAGLPYLPQLLSGAPEVLARIGLTFPVTTLDVAWGGAFQRIDPDGTTTTLTDPAALPPGRWSVTVVAETGQTWTVPNELDTALDAALPPPGVTSGRDPGQGRTVAIGG